MKYLYIAILILLTGCNEEAVEHERPAIYLSFDDYYQSWEYILTAYDNEPVQFTFFINKGVGSVIRKLSDKGHIIGNHTYTHLNMANTEREFSDVLNNEVLELNEEISDIANVTAFAFPFGAFTSTWESELLKYFTHLRRFSTKENKPHFYEANNIDEISIVASSSIDNIYFNSDAEYYEYIDSIVEHLTNNGGMVSITTHAIGAGDWAIYSYRLDYLVRVALDNGIVFKGF